MEEMGRSSEEGDRGGQPECFDGLGEEGEPSTGSTSGWRTGTPVEIASP